MRKHSHPCVIRFHKVLKLKSAEQCYLCLLQLFMPWRKESDLKHEDGTYGSKYKKDNNEIVENVKRHEPYLDIDNGELESYNFLNSDDDSYSEEFSMLNPRLIGLAEKRHGKVSGGSILATSVVDTYQMKYITIFAVS